MRYGIDKLRNTATIGDIPIDLLSKINCMLKYGDVMALSPEMRAQLDKFRRILSKIFDEKLYGPNKVDVELYKANYIREAKELKVNVGNNGSPEEIDSILSQNLCSTCSNNPGTCVGHIGRNGGCHLFVPKDIDISK
jgi:hypothetical protein